MTDLTPNIGVFWYFMTEIFDRFRTFFLFCFHGHIIAYVIPLVYRFWYVIFVILKKVVHPRLVQAEPSLPFVPADCDPVYLQIVSSAFGYLILSMFATSAMEVLGS